MKLVASLPWYDHPSSTSALDTFWDSMRVQLLSVGLEAVPASLDRSLSLEKQWRHSGLLVSQCCGPDLYTEFAGLVSCLGRPVFTDLECESGYYYSHIVSRGAVAANPVVAINSPTSWSGNAALFKWLGARGEVSRRHVISGSHQNSLELLRTGQVDLVAIDAHSWNLLDTEGVAIVGRSDVAATPPFISGIENAVTRLKVRAALSQSIASSGQLVGISALLDASKALYEPIDSACHAQMQRDALAARG